MGAEQQLAMDSAAAAAVAAVAGGTGAGKTAVVPPQPQPIALVQPLLGRLAARSMTGLAPSSVQDAQAAGPGVAALPLEVPERCAFAAAHAHLARLSGCRQVRVVRHPASSLQLLFCAAKTYASTACSLSSSAFVHCLTPATSLIEHDARIAHTCCACLVGHLLSRPSETWGCPSLNARQVLGIGEIFLYLFFTH